MLRLREMGLRFGEISRSTSLAFVFAFGKFDKFEFELVDLAGIGGETIVIKGIVVLFGFIGISTG